ncbi:MAG: SPOR domain-containing protein [Alphaproteobacteria bacterium]|nr:SPOR domain-containing protein [Alphaproteobacteria bacterium]MDP6564133.1 SPOR domain-containing protein [Alphaproteobacteria bacterium]MDP6815552.1 SPOR domain-containing protein [Alphaproteobacteria bacterium]
MLAGCAAKPPPVESDEGSRLGRSLYEAAESSEQRRDFATAAAYYRNLYRRDPADLSAVVGLARALRRLLQAKEARAILLRAMKDRQNDADLLAELGKVQLVLGKPMKAIHSLSRIGAGDSKRWDVEDALGVAYDRIGMYPQAERRYRKALVLSPENATVLNNLALSMAQAERLDDAIEMLERAAALPEATPRMRQNLAMLYALKGDLATAEQYVRRDLPADIADQNMAYYRQLQKGMTGGASPIRPPAIAPPRKGELPATGGDKAKTPKSMTAAAAEPATKAEAMPKAAAVAAETDKTPAKPAPAAQTTVTKEPAKTPAADAATATAKATPKTKPKGKAAKKAKAEQTASRQSPDKAAAGPSYRLQLGSFRDADRANDLRKRLLERHAKLLEGVDLRVEGVKVAGRGEFFRVQSKPVAGRALAEDTCLKLAVRDVPCMLVRVP